jgi:hypothetical protein
MLHAILRFVWCKVVTTFFTSNCQVFVKMHWNRQPKNKGVQPELLFPFQEQLTLEAADSRQIPISLIEPGKTQLVKTGNPISLIDPSLSFSARFV